ncbi:hypothetical protein DFH06DRAFT_1137147 [Mycena polygramma]|nr:hypothetical protein DFH06DRAFT_1137147 [Mycena polygramma]
MLLGGSNARLARNRLAHSAETGAAWGRAFASPLASSSSWAPCSASALPGWSNTLWGKEDKRTAERWEYETRCPISVANCHHHLRLRLAVPGGCVAGSGVLDTRPVSVPHPVDRAPRPMAVFNGRDYLTLRRSRSSLVMNHGRLSRTRNGLLVAGSRWDEDTDGRRLSMPWGTYIFRLRVSRRSSRPVKPGQCAPIKRTRRRTADSSASERGCRIDAVQTRLCFSRRRLRPHPASGLKVKKDDVDRRGVAWNTVSISDITVVLTALHLFEDSQANDGTEEGRRPTAWTPSSFLPSGPVRPDLGASPDWPLDVKSGRGAVGSGTRFLAQLASLFQHDVVHDCPYISVAFGIVGQRLQDSWAPGFVRGWGLMRAICILQRASG